MTELNRANAHSFRIESEGDHNPFYYWTIGNPKNPPLLCIPGITGTHRDLLAFSHKLSEHFFVIVPDMPGWGASPRLKEKLTIKHYAEFLVAMIDDLKLKKILVVGHCMGAALGIEFSTIASERVEKLVLISTPYVDGSWINTLFVKFTAWEIKWPALYPLFYFWRNKMVIFFSSLFILKFKSRRKIWRLSKEKFTHPTELNLQVLKENWRSVLHYNYKKVKQLNMPIYLIHGAHDIMVDKRHAYAFQKLVPDAPLRFLPTAGHIPPVETPGALATIVREYLTDYSNTNMSPQAV